MLAKSCPKVSLQSQLNRESFDAKFCMGECARNNYGVTLNGNWLSYLYLTCVFDSTSICLLLRAGSCFQWVYYSTENHQSGKIRKLCHVTRVKKNEHLKQHYFTSVWYELASSLIPWWYVLRFKTLFNPMEFNYNFSEHR